MKIFLSAVSSELRSYRLKLANHLGALKAVAVEVRVQEDFAQGGDTLLQALTDYIRDCDCVIHLVGDACGARPTATHEQDLLTSLGLPAEAPGRSYTQWEYHLARHFGKRRLTYLIADAAPRDCGFPIPQTEDEAACQQAHRATLDELGEHWTAVGSHQALVRAVFYDLELNPEQVKVSNLPYKSLGTLFKGRDDFLAQIRQRLGEMEHRGHRRAAAITACATSLHGLGGVGKTRAAVEYAHRHADDYTALLFIRAETPESLQANLAALCGPMVLDLAEQRATEREVQVGAALTWLQAHPGWCLIIDNVDTEGAAREVEALLSRLSASGQVLITSRLANWSGAVEALALDVLAEADAVAFLLERTAGCRRPASGDDEQAGLLARTLGQLALALEQASAMIRTNCLSFAQYLADWEGNREKVMTWFDARQMQYPMSVAVTWQTSFDQLGLAAAQLLRCLAWLAPDPIPESLIESYPLPESDPAVAPLTLLGELEGVSLISRSTSEPTCAVHRLVQEVMRSRQQGDGEAAALPQALAWINAAFVGDPQDVRTWSILEPLAPHAIAVADSADASGLSDPTSRLFNQLGLLLLAKALHRQAEPLMRRALSIDEASYGANHPEVAIRLSNLALLLQATNRLSDAEPLMRRALSIDEASYGANHPEVATDLNNLAQLLQATNRLSDAEPLMRRALAIDEASHGADHPDVGMDLNNLAQLLLATNRLSDAEPLMRRALAIDETSYGADHPEVATDLNNLAQLLQATNRLSDAEPLMRRALAIDESSYGENHPLVAIRLNNLASLLLATNRLSDAEPLMRRSLAIDEASYGENHPDVATDLNNLAQLLQATNRLSDAEPLMRRALAIDESSYGENHPRVAIDLNNLASLLLATNRLSDAEPLMRRHAEIFLAFTRDTGHPHLHLQAALGNYRALLEAQGQTREQARSTVSALCASYGVQLGG